MRLIFIISILFSLSACATEKLAEGSGQTRVNWNNELRSVDQVPYIKSVTYIDGKERASARITIEFNEGEVPTPKITVSTTDSVAFEGQAEAAGAVKTVVDRLAEAGVQITPQIVDVIIKALVPTSPGNLPSLPVQ